MHPGRNHLAAVHVLEADQATQAAAVAEAFPLFAGHALKRGGLPEGTGHGVCLAGRRGRRHPAGRQDLDDGATGFKGAR